MHLTYNICKDTYVHNLQMCSRACATGCIYIYSRVSVLECLHVHVDISVCVYVRVYAFLLLAVFPYVST